MKTCPTCKGSGTQSVTVTEYGRKPYAFETECVTCEGQRHITDKHFQQFTQQERLWCACKEPGEFVFWADGENPHCSKHCWTCSDCGKLLQVG